MSPLLTTGIRASLDLLSVAPDEVTVPLFLACYRAPLGPSPFGLHIAGRTGNGKSVLQGLFQAHWGISFDHQSIPGNWQSTKTALEVLTFAAKDAPRVRQGSIRTERTIGEQPCRTDGARNEEQSKPGPYADGRPGTNPRGRKPMKARPAHPGMLGRGGTGRGSGRWQRN